MEIIQIVHLNKSKGGTFLLLGLVEFLEIAAPHFDSAIDLITSDLFLNFLTENNHSFNKRNQIQNRSPIPNNILHLSHRQVFQNSMPMDLSKVRQLVIQFHSFYLCLRGQDKVRQAKKIVGNFYKIVDYYICYPQLQDQDASLASIDFSLLKNVPTTGDYLVSANLDECHGMMLDYILENHDFSCQISDFTASSYAAKTNGHRALAPEKMRTIFRNYLGPCKPIRHVENITGLDHLKIPVFYSQGLLVNQNISRQDDYVVHGGKGTSINQAYVSACGEALERFCAQRMGNEQLIIGSYDRLKKDYPIDLLTGYLQTDHTQSINWQTTQMEYLWATQLNSKINKTNKNNKTLIPAHRVFFPFTETHLPQQAKVDTTGLSAGHTIAAATLQGMLECIERDALYQNFFSNTKLPTIILDRVRDRKLQQLLNKLKNKLHLHLKLIPNATSAYVVHATAENRGPEFPRYTHGAGASLDIEVALARAITECCQLRISQKEILQFQLKDPEFLPYYQWGDGNKQWVHNLRCRSADPKTLLSSLPRHSSGNFQQDLQLLTKELSSYGHDVYVANLSRFDDFKVVRVIVSDFLNTASTKAEIFRRVGEKNICHELWQLQVQMFT